MEHRPEFEEIGKSAIAAAILHFHSRQKLRPKDGDWYGYLFNAMRSADNEFGNNLSIITFNYDLSLEMYFEKAIISTFPNLNWIEWLSNLPLIHLHGRLEEPSEQLEAYFRTPRFETAKASNIKIIHKMDSNDSEFLNARNLLEKADVICFLGFGFEERNVRRLFPDRTFWETKTLYASAKGFTESEIKMKSYEFFERRLNFGFKDCLTTLRELGVLI